MWIPWFFGGNCHFSPHPINQSITVKLQRNHHWLPLNPMKSGAAGVARSGVGTIEGLHDGAHVVPVFLGGRSQGVFSRWFDLWENIGIHGISMGFWWDFHGTWWDFDGLSWDFIIRILARASDYVNSSKFGIWSLKRTLTVNWDFNKKKLANSPTNGDNKLGEDSFFGSLLRICLSWFQQQEKPVLSFK